MDTIQNPKPDRNLTETNREAGECKTDAYAFVYSFCYRCHREIVSVNPPNICPFCQYRFCPSCTE